MTPLEIRVDDGRCYFEPFNASNDQDPQSHKGGVHRYRYAWWGMVLSWLGWATSLNGSDEKVHYIEKKNLDAWIKRHNGPKEGNYH